MSFSIIGLSEVAEKVKVGWWVPVLAFFCWMAGSAVVTVFVEEEKEGDDVTMMC